MDADRFDALTRTLTSGGTSRRRLLTRLAGSAVGTIAAALGVAEADALHYPCRHVGKPCKRNSQCCSGLCRGPRDRKTCRAHHVGTCTINQNTCTNFTAICAGGACQCYRTTGGASFCASPADQGCKVCTTDAQCVRKLGIAGSACVDFTQGTCASFCGANITATCLAPCTAPA